MLDDMNVLRDAVAVYRAAATSAGLTWPEPVAPGAPPTELVLRLFDVNHVPEQVTWIHSQGWDLQRYLPNGGFLLPWPTDGRPLDDLTLAVATPFPWRRQLPLFHFEYLIYTFVLAGEHEGEIWRYEISPDAWDCVRAATSLASLFAQWTKGIKAGAVRYTDHNGWLMCGPGSGNDFAIVQDLQERAPDLDPLAFPISMPTHPLLRARQAECGVDMSRVEVDRGSELQEELMDEVDAIRARLGV